MKRTSLKKHDSAVESRALKARRDRVTTQVRKDKRRQAVQSKRRRLMSGDSELALTGRDITELVQILADTSSASIDSHQERFNVLREIRVMLSTHEHDYDTVEKIIESGIVPIMVNLLNSASPLASTTRTGGEVYREILWCLTNIASGQYAHTKLVLPAVPRLLQFLAGANPTLAEHAAWVLGNIAADCAEFRQQLIAHGAVAALVQQLAGGLGGTNSAELQKISAWALSNIARGHETSAKAFIDAGLIPALTIGLAPRTSANPRAFSDDTVVEVAWLLSFVTAREEVYLQQLVASDVLALLLPRFATANELLGTPLLRVFGNVCCANASNHTTDNWQLPFVLTLLQRDDAAFIKTLRAFLAVDVAAEHAHLTAEAAWVLSNLAALDATVVNELLGDKEENELLTLLAIHMRDTSSFEVRREVAFALTNIALTTPKLLDAVVALDVLPAFLALLGAADVAVVGNSLRFVENMLRTAPRGVQEVELHDGIDALERVQFDSSEEHLSQWAAALVNEFYGENYGVHSPPSGPMAMAGAAGSDFANLSVLQPPAPQQFAFGAAHLHEQQQPQQPGGRGRGAHMTTPAWKK